MPGMFSPAVAFCISSAIIASTFALASAWAAISRSSSTSRSSADIREGSMVTLLRSPLPDSETFTMPAPDWPSTTWASSLACISCIFDCICWACLSMLVRFFMRGCPG